MITAHQFFGFGMFQGLNSQLSWSTKNPFGQQCGTLFTHVSLFARVLLIYTCGHLLVLAVSKCRCLNSQCSTWNGITMGPRCSWRIEKRFVVLSFPCLLIQELLKIKALKMSSDWKTICKKGSLKRRDEFERLYGYGVFTSMLENWMQKRVIWTNSWVFCYFLSYAIVVYIYYITLEGFTRANLRDYI